MTYKSSGPAPTVILYWPCGPNIITLWDKFGTQIQSLTPRDRSERSHTSCSSAPSQPIQKPTVHIRCSTGSLRRLKKTHCGYSLHWINNKWCARSVSLRKWKKKKKCHLLSQNRAPPSWKLPRLLSPSCFLSPFFRRMFFISPVSGRKLCCERPSFTARSALIAHTSGKQPFMMSEDASLIPVFEAENAYVFHAALWRSKASLWIINKSLLAKSSQQYGGSQTGGVSREKILTAKKNKKKTLITVDDGDNRDETDLFIFSSPLFRDTS